MIGKVTHNIFRRRIKFCLYPIFIISFVFIIYQIIIFSQLNNDRSIVEYSTGYAGGILVRGIHENNAIFYQKRQDDTFKCIHSMEIINFNQVNDDYCDCTDGSDEPGTNACPNGDFFCKKQISLRNSPVRIPSNRVNDGICDCCDGSDEWMNKTRTDITGENIDRS